jgi:hypothetical protein
MAEGILCPRERCEQNSISFPDDECGFRCYLVCCNRRRLVMSIDTTNDAEQVQLAILRRMSSSERLELALDLTATSRKLLAEGVRQRHPGYTSDEVRLAVIRLLIPESLFNDAYPQAVSIRP